jgi:hypothetical protein
MSAEDEESEITSGVDPIVTEESQSGVWGAEGRSIGLLGHGKGKGQINIKSRGRAHPRHKSQIVGAEGAASAIMAVGRNAVSFVITVSPANDPIQASA